MRTLVLFCTALAGAAPSLAQSALPAPGQTAQGDVAVTIYNNDRALIEDKRLLDLPAGRSRQEFRDVSATIEPATVTLNGRGVGVIEQNFDFDLLSPSALMQNAVGQEVTFNVLALPGKTIPARLNYVATAIDPATRRLLVRATIDNKKGLLKPEMFANVTIYSASDHPAVGVPKQALIYEGDQVRIWVAREDKSIELRQIKPGLTNGDLVEVVGNLRPGEQIVTKGSLFIDRAASGS